VGGVQGDNNKHWETLKWGKLGKRLQAMGELRGHQTMLNIVEKIMGALDILEKYQGILGNIKKCKG